MATSSTKLDLLLNSIEENCDPTRYRAAWIPYLIACAALVEHRMPAVAIASFGVSRDYAAGRVSMQSVREAMQRCWEDLQKGHREMRLDDPQVSAVRAVICVLQRQLEPESDDFLDFTSFFLQVVDNVEPHPDEEEALLREHFGLCLDAAD